ncbi:MAG: hypothetical protein PHV33_05025 [Elusimicrobiales bacterium]|nr:hypothetical protein [Elusimicrobiales bacterium]
MKNHHKSHGRAMGRLTAEYVGVGVVVSLLSAFLGFYGAAFVIADKCYPELGLETIQLVHRALFHNMALAAAVYSIFIFSLYWVFARGQIRRLRELQH